MGRAMASIDLGGGITASLEPKPSMPMVRFAGVPGQGESAPARADVVLFADLHDKDLQILPADKTGTPYRLTPEQVSLIARALVGDKDLARAGHFRVTWVGVGTWA